MSNALEGSGKIDKRIAEIETAMALPDFWSDKMAAQAMIKELGELKDMREGVGKYDKGDAVLTIIAGAGGDDAEDFARMLREMYERYFARRGWGVRVLHQNENDHGGYRNLTLEVSGKNAYGTLKNESGVHRLVRVSPFSAKSLRHTSFVLVEFIPKFEKASAREMEISEQDLRVEFARSSGPGGQNVNKRETAVRVVHIPTNIAVHCDSERSQLQNREIAMDILRGKLYKKIEEDRKKEQEGMYISKTMEIEWGNQIRSYVLHPYQMVKDHRTDVEVRNTDRVLKDGDLDEFIEAEKAL
ncbi:MAG: PCRF domain-containing protein [Patescibacteria group bacterium]